MKVTIVGCGALGSLVAFRLISSGKNVRVFQREGAQLAALKEQGILYKDREGKTERVPCSARSELDGVEPADLAIVLVKAYQTEAASKALKNHLAEGGVALTLQNGLGNAEILAKVLGVEKVAAGTCTYGAHRLAPGKIAWGGDGVLRFGPWGREKDLSAVEALFREAGFEVRPEKDPRRSLWEKVILNASANTVSALTRLRNGQMLASRDAVELMREIVNEGVRGARTAGVEFDSQKMWGEVERVLEKTARNKTSMLQDVESQRKTEVDAIVGSLVKQARHEKEKLVRLETVYALIKSLEKGFESETE